MSFVIVEKEGRNAIPQQQPFAEFFSRLKLQRLIVDIIKKGGERWPYNWGFYKDDQHTLINQLTLSSDTAPEPIAFQDYLSDLAEKLLQRSKQDKPVILLDMGGGAGQTWKEVASSFMIDIKSSRLAFVVSNLAWPPEEGQKMIHFINSTFHKLCDHSIELPNGDILPLKSNVDVVHESQSLTRWSQVPELDIPSVARLLSCDGSLYISSPNTPCKCDLAENREENLLQRMKAVRKAWNWLQQRYDLLSINQVEDGTYAGADLLYRVFRQPTAPPVIV